MSKEDYNNPFHYANEASAERLLILGRNMILSENFSMAFNCLVTSHMIYRRLNKTTQAEEASKLVQTATRGIDSLLIIQ